MQVGNRIDDKSRFTWTLCSLVVRVARAIGLHRETSAESLTTFDREMRRRVWCTIVGLDVQTAADRSAELATPSDGFHCPLPKNINDSEIYPGFNGPLEDREGFTDMTTPLVELESSRLLAYLDFGVVPGPVTEEDVSWEGRRRRIVEFQERLERKYLRHCNPKFPLQWFALMIGNIVDTQGKSRRTRRAL